MPLIRKSYRKWIVSGLCEQIGMTIGTLQDRARFSGNKLSISCRVAYFTGWPEGHLVCDRFNAICTA
jgi:hypothetical protein